LDLPITTLPAAVESTLELVQIVISASDDSAAGADCAENDITGLKQIKKIYIL
jgi:hypothetical protein